MRLFKTLFNNLFGTVKEYAVEGLGIFTAKVWDRWPSECYTWISTVQLPLYSGETVILIEGDASAPYRKQVSDLQTLLEKWESILSRLDNLLVYESRLARKQDVYASWRDKFYPDAITPSYPDNDAWEISFIIDDSDHYFTFTWRNNTVQDLIVS